MIPAAHLCSVLLHSPPSSLYPGRYIYREKLVIMGLETTDEYALINHLLISKFLKRI